jgi:hypothetical protein
MRRPRRGTARRRLRANREPRAEPRGLVSELVWADDGKTARPARTSGGGHGAAPKRIAGRFFRFEAGFEMALRQSALFQELLEVVESLERAIRGRGVSAELAEHESHTTGARQQERERRSSPRRRNARCRCAQRGRRPECLLPPRAGLRPGSPTRMSESWATTLPGGLLVRNSAGRQAGRVNRTTRGQQDRSASLTSHVRSAEGTRGERRLPMK